MVVVVVVGSRGLPKNEGTSKKCESFFRLSHWYPKLCPGLSFELSDGDQSGLIAILKPLGLSVGPVLRH